MRTGELAARPGQGRSGSAGRPLSAARRALQLLGASVVLLLPLGQRFAADRHLPGGGLALFRIDPDGAGITLLARAPVVEAELGKRLRGPLFNAIQQRPVGWFDDQTQVDGLRRVVAYQRLDGVASSLLLGFGMRTDDVLLAWHAALPWQGGITALILGLALFGIGLAGPGAAFDRSRHRCGAPQRGAIARRVMCHRCW